MFEREKNNPMNIQNNLNIDLENIINSNFQPRIKLDEVMESIKQIKTNYNVIEDIRISVKILKRMKMTESCKW